MLLDLDSPITAVSSLPDSLLSEESKWVETEIEGDVETQVFAAMILWEKFSLKIGRDINLKDNFLEFIQPAIKRGRNGLYYANDRSYPVVCASCYRYFCHTERAGECLNKCSRCANTHRPHLYPFLLSISPLFVSHNSFLAGQHRTLTARLIFQHYYPRTREGARL
jgi:hypothetical protein